MNYSVGLYCGSRMLCNRLGCSLTSKGGTEGPAIDRIAPGLDHGILSGLYLNPLAVNPLSYISTGML